MRANNAFQIKPCQKSNIRVVGEERIGSRIRNRIRSRKEGAGNLQTNLERLAAFVMRNE